MSQCETCGADVLTHETRTAVFTPYRDHQRRWMADVLLPCPECNNVVELTVEVVDGG